MQNSKAVIAGVASNAAVFLVELFGHFFELGLQILDIPILLFDSFLIGHVITDQLVLHVNRTLKFLFERLILQFQR